ncbi:hypothetical protein PG999_002263 [Apiospora kogelbergensis]|uniref:VWFA domain-containing protein n=1 Tax=Apiospora kogelbergensis TaxID=1337665 RepID=A0AAW0R7X5_9PEZI
MDPSNSSRRSSRFLSRLNPFSTDKDSSLTQNSKGAGFSISRSLSQRSSNQQQQRAATATTTSADPPPAYAETNNVSSTGASTRDPAISSSIAAAYPALSAANISTRDDEFAFLASFDTVFLIDDSGSMAGSSWREVGAVLQGIVPICVEHDSDGVDLYFLNHKTNETLDKETGKAGTGYRGITSASRVEAIFGSMVPNGRTPTGERLLQILRPYLNKYRKVVNQTEDVFGLKPLNIIVITDGVAHSDPEPPIVTAARELDELRAPGYQIGIQFFQVGDDQAASRALQQLDDGLASYGIRDIVDTCWFAAGERGTLTSEKLLKVVLGAVDKRIDRKDTRTAEAKRK